MPSTGPEFPIPLDSYPPVASSGLFQTLVDRAHQDPFNLVATAIFALAIGHTFLTPKIRHWAHVVEDRHRAAAGSRKLTFADDDGNEVPEVSIGGQILHLLSEVEAVFGIWAVVLAVLIIAFRDWNTAVDYIGHKVNFTEPMFVMVIMAQP